MLHLNLIGWGMPIGTGLQGLKDTLACLLEAYASSVVKRNRTQTVISYIPLKARNVPQLGPAQCSHMNQSFDRSNKASSLVSSDNLEESLECPLEESFVLSIQQGHVTCVVPQKVSWFYSCSIMTVASEILRNKACPK